MQFLKMLVIDEGLVFILAVMALHGSFFEDYIGLFTQDILPTVPLTKFAITIVSNITGFLAVPRVNCSPRGGCLVSKSEQ